MSVTVFVAGKPFVELSDITYCPFRKVVSGSTGSRKSKEEWENDWKEEYLCLDTVGSYFIEVSVQSYHNGQLSPKMHTTFGLVEYLWIHKKNVEVWLDMSGVRLEATEWTMRNLACRSRTIRICEEMVEETNKKRKRNNGSGSESSESSSTNLIVHRVGTFLQGDNYLTITNKTGHPLLKVFPAFRQLVFEQIGPKKTKFYQEYSVRISQYDPTRRGWGKKSQPVRSDVLKHTIILEDKGTQKFSNPTSYFSNYFDVHLLKLQG